jgi:hypothetical protein
VSIDQTPPTITTAVSPPANADGWNNTDVTVIFACTDALSGIATCTPPVTVSAESANQVITGAATDNAGNTTTLTVTVNVDKTNPAIMTARTPANGSGWNNGDVTVTFTCTDPLSGIAVCPSLSTISTEGAGQSVAGTATDRAGNSATATATGINIDKTPPVLGAPAWTNNPKQVDGTTPVTAVLVAPASDALSGVQSGEYFIGADPGVGSGNALSYANGSFTATLGAGLAVGVYDVGVRGQDTAGNWSAVTKTMLVVFDPASAGITGRNNKDLVPSLAAGDILPGLTQNGQADAADYGFTVDYRNGSMDPRNDFHFTYDTGSQCNTPHPVNCHQFSLDATSFQWLVIDQTNNSRGRFQGTATIVVDGTTSTNPFTIEGIDGDRLTPTTADHLTLKIYAPDADPSTATPAYQASGSIGKSTGVRVR